RCGIEPIERLGVHAAGERHGEDLAGQRDVEWAVFGAGQGVGDRVIGEGGGEEHRAVGFLAPEVAPDVGGRGGAVVEFTPGVADYHDAGTDASRRVTERLADHDRAAAAIEDGAGLQIVGAEVHERPDGPRLADDLGDGQLVEPVLRRDHAPGG